MKVLEIMGSAIRKTKWNRNKIEMKRNKEGYGKIKKWRSRDKTREWERWINQRTMTLRVTT
jgi:hypothetical protein